MNKKEFYSELRIRCTEETSNLDRTWSSWFLYQQTLLMSLIPKSKANSSAAEYRTVSTLKLSWRKEDTHTKLWGELRATSAPQTHPWSCCQTLPQLSAHLLLQRQLPQTVSGTGHTQMPNLRLHISRTESAIIQSFITLPTAQAFILFSCASFAFFVSFNSQGLHRNTTKSQGTVSHN